MDTFLTIAIIYLLGCIINYISAITLVFFDQDVDDLPGLLYFMSWITFVLFIVVAIIIGIDEILKPLLNPSRIGKKLKNKWKNRKKKVLDQSLMLDLISRIRKNVNRFNGFKFSEYINWTKWIWKVIDK